MKGEEYRKVLARLDLTQVAAARFLGVDDSTSRRWIADRHQVPLSVAMLLRLMVRYKLSPEKVEAITNRRIRA